MVVLGVLMIDVGSHLGAISLLIICAMPVDAAAKSGTSPVSRAVVVAAGR